MACPVQVSGCIADCAGQVRLLVFSIGSSWWLARAVGVDPWQGWCLSICVAGQKKKLFVFRQGRRLRPMSYPHAPAIVLSGRLSRGSCCNRIVPHSCGRAIRQGGRCHGVHSCRNKGRCGSSMFACGRSRRWGSSQASSILCPMPFCLNCLLPFLTFKGGYLFCPVPFCLFCLSAYLKFQGE